MQERQKNRKLYFEELSITSKKYYIPYISKFKKIKEGMNILEIGCGDGGNLLPFAELGCSTTGVDILRMPSCFLKKDKSKETSLHPISSS